MQQIHIYIHMYMKCVCVCVTDLQLALLVGQFVLAVCQLPQHLFYLTVSYLGEKESYKRIFF